ncbi:DsbA family protein [Polluticaenibacter yanchengensis]|uniref:DsbA family protein n=1 Tax=Polluticaenibacter yanchengensis TaxID=3014562 RepID=A0ABT4UI25_9BACT|nr:DsbA family protein [Chitinophagaceae bacterium LY-5]
MTIYYCYDAYCGWCYGFSPVIKKLKEKYNDKFFFEVLSGGMIPKESVKPVSAIAGYISTAYKTVEESTGIKFGEDFLWHIFNPDLSDWFPCSEKPAVALCIFKELHPDKQVEFASDLQYALNYEGRDLCDNEAYRHLLEKYEINADDFYSKLESQVYIDAAKYEFQLCKQLQVTGYPQVLLQVEDTKFYLVSKGYSDFDTVEKTLESILASLN